MSPRITASALAGLAALLCVAAGAQRPESSSIATYTARYEVRYKGRRVGHSTFSVRYDEDARVYEFTSHTTATGLLRLISPNPIVEHSRFELRGGRIQPLYFSYEDGTRKGEDDFQVSFDWEARVAQVSGNGWQRSLPLEPGVLDRGSLQVALMRDLARGDASYTYLMADDDSIRRYRYEPSGEEAVEVPFGKVQATLFIQQREGSSRRTLLWVAPHLSHLPVKIEQQREGETRMAFLLESVDGL